MSDTKLLMNPQQATMLLDRVIFEQVCDQIGLGRLRDLEEHLATEISRLEDMSDAQMLARARDLIARALRRLADHIEAGSPPPPMELEHRYVNAVCAEFAPARTP